jgi:hypothetical protein
LGCTYFPPRQRPRELLGYPDGYKMGIFSENLLAGMDCLNGRDTGCRHSMRFDGILHLVDSRDGLLLFALRQKRFLIYQPATRDSGLPCRHWRQSRPLWSWRPGSTSTGRPTSFECCASATCHRPVTSVTQRVAASAHGFAPTLLDGVAPSFVTAAPMDGADFRFLPLHV